MSNLLAAVFYTVGAYSFASLLVVAVTRGRFALPKLRTLFGIGEDDS
jgi:hypothetical protein